MKKVLVSANLMALLEETANEIMQQGDADHGRDWIDENRTSDLSSKKGGVLKYETDHDWKVAFFIWYCGSPRITKKLPRG